MIFKAEFLRGDETRETLVQAGLSLLDQALSGGVEVDFSCRRGDCGQCIASLIKGEVGALDSSRNSYASGGIYLCNTIARSDISVKLPYAPETKNIPVLRCPAKINNLMLLSRDVMELTFRLPPGKQFNFLPGQYIRISRGGITRSYSLAEPPSSTNQLKLHIKRVPGGVFSEYVFSSASIGDLLQLEGPMGKFFVRDAARVSKTICLATGTGIAPIYALLSGLNGDQQRRCGAIQVYWGNSYCSDTYLMERLSAQVSALGGILELVYSREADIGGKPTHVQEAMALKDESLADAQVFAAGNLAMVEAARGRCEGMGLLSERFFSDPFTAS